MSILPLMVERDYQQPVGFVGLSSSSFIRNDYLLCNSRFVHRERIDAAHG